MHVASPMSASVRWSVSLLARARIFAAVTVPDMAAPEKPLPTIAPIAPHMKMLEFLAQETGRNDLPALLDCFAALPGDTDLFCKADVSSMHDLAAQIRDFSLPLNAQFALCACPVDTRSGDHMRIWRQWVAMAADFNVPSKRHDQTFGLRE